jgi:hypothetical protein
MEVNIYDLFTKMDIFKVSNGKYYKLVDFEKILNHLSESNVEVDEHIITPFYICDKGVLELYDYELNIRQVDSPNIDNFILIKTGKTSLNEVNPVIKQKIRKCYLETIKPNKYLQVSKLQEYFCYVRTSSDLRESINDYLNEYEENKLFFEVY